MYKITIICLGKLKEKSYKDLEQEFLKRLSPFAKIKMIELNEESYRSKSEVDKIKLLESEKIKKHIPTEAFVVVLNENGKLNNSLQFSEFLDHNGSHGQEIVFIIGSGVGLDPSLLLVADYNLSLSPLTFPHNMARVLLLEQIYRGATISSGKEYHK